MRSGKMIEKQSPESGYQAQSGAEGGVELIEYLWIVWRWRYVIVAGGLALAIIAGVASAFIPTPHSVRVVLRPGIVDVKAGGSSVYLDSPENMKASIELGTFNEEILSNLRESKQNPLPTSLDFVAQVPKESNALVVSYDTHDEELGLRVLGQLVDILKKNYAERVSYFKTRHEANIVPKRLEIADLTAQQMSTERSLKNTERRIGELENEIRTVSENTRTLVDERNKFLSTNSNEKTILSTILYTNTIQQNMSLERSCRKELEDYLSKKETQILYIESLKGDLKRNAEELKMLEMENDNIRNIEVLQEPGSVPSPGGRSALKSAGAAAVAGMVLMLFLAFFIEYIQSHKGKVPKRSSLGV